MAAASELQFLPADLPPARRGTASPPCADPGGFWALLGDRMAGADPQAGPVPDSRRLRRDTVLLAAVPVEPCPAPAAWAPTLAAGITNTGYATGSDAAPNSNLRGSLAAYPAAKAPDDPTAPVPNGSPNALPALLIQLPDSAPSGIPDNPPFGPPAGPPAEGSAQDLSAPLPGRPPLPDPGSIKDPDPESNPDSSLRRVVSPASDATVRGGIPATPEAGAELAFTARMRLPEPAGAIPPAPAAQTSAVALPLSSTPPETRPVWWRTPSAEILSQSESAPIITGNSPAQSSLARNGETSQHKNDPQPDPQAAWTASRPAPPAGSNDIAEGSDRALPTSPESGHPVYLLRKVIPDTLSARTHSAAAPPPPTAQAMEDSGKAPLNGNLTAETASAPAANPAPAQAPAADVRTREVNVEMPPLPAPAASHDVALRLANGPNSVDIRMAERAGEIRVTVHTPDHSLADSLRAGLPDLVDRLRQTGYQTEAWHPQLAQSRRAGEDPSNSQQHSPGAGKDGRQPPPQQQQKDQSRWAGEWQSRFDPAQEHEI